MRTNGCKCGAIQVTEAAWRQMSAQKRADVDRQIRDCPTCKRDRDNQRVAVIRGGASGKGQVSTTTIGKLRKDLGR